MQSGQQWDYPNAWPPLQWFLVEGLLNANTTEANELALKLAKLWIYSNLKGFETQGTLFEKYDSRLLGFRGYGGEYIAQDGFAWTNGVLLSLINRFSKHLSLQDYQYHQRYLKKFDTRCSLQRPPDPLRKSLMERTASQNQLGSHKKSFFSNYFK